MFIVVYEVYFSLGVCIIDPPSVHFLARIRSKGEDFVLCLHCERNSASVWGGDWWDATSYSEKCCFDPSCILFCLWEACCLCWNLSYCVTYRNLATRCDHLTNEGVRKPQTSGLRHHVRSLLCLSSDYPEDGVSRLLQNASSITIYMMSNPRRVESSPELMWRSQISCDLLCLTG